MMDPDPFVGDNASPTMWVEPTRGKRSLAEVACPPAHTVKSS